MGDVDAWVERMRAQGATVSRERYVCDDCEDTGWVTVDDGLDEKGRRVRVGSARKCTNEVHHWSPVIEREGREYQ